MKFVLVSTLIILGAPGQAPSVDRSFQVFENQAACDNARGFLIAGELGERDNIMSHETRSVLVGKRDVEVDETLMCLPLGKEK